MNNDYQGYAEACGRGANAGIVTGAVGGAVAGLVIGGGGFVPGAITSRCCSGVAGCVQGMMDYEPRDSQGRTGSDRYTLGLNDRS